MRLFPNNLSSYEGILFTFGFPVPIAFARFLGGLYEYSDKDSQKSLALFERLTGRKLDGVNARYQQTPPELFPIASLGVDGVHYGCVIHAPELPAEDYPTGQIAPMDKDGVTLVGKTIQEALESFVANVIEDEKDEWQREEILRLSQVLGLKPDIEKAGFLHGIDDYALPITPKVPSNWRYIPSSDGVGVLAPAEKFDPEPPLSVNDKCAPGEYIIAADKALANAFPATALYYLREGYWHNWTDAAAAQRFSYRMATAYTELNRSLLAEVAAWRVSRFFVEKRHL